MSGFDFTDAVGFTPPVDNPVTLASATLSFLDAFSSVTSPALDMRAYNSTISTWSVEKNGGSAVNFDYYDVTLAWFMTLADAAAFSNPVYFETFEVWLRDTPPGLNRMSLIAPVYAPFMHATVIENNGRTAYVSYSIAGSFRQLPSVFTRVTIGGNGGTVLFNDRVVLGAGATSIKAAYMGYGPVHVKATSGAGGGCQVDIDYASLVGMDRLIVGAANTVGDKFVTFPKCQARVTIKNTGGAQSTIDVLIVEQLQPI